MIFAYMLEILGPSLLEALLDSLKALPFLLLVYVLIELAEYRFGDGIRRRLQKAGAAGPALGALAGALPQCGFSVLATALYSQRLATIGTLLAVYLSTSDEAIPVILAAPEKAYLVWPLLASKIVIALIFGFAFDWIFRRQQQAVSKHANAFSCGQDEAGHNHQGIVEERACCGHCLNPQAKRFSFKEIFWHPLLHTLKIFVFIFLASAILNIIIALIGEEALSSFLQANVSWQPLLAAIFGLIPNCVSSVVLAQLYVDGLLTFGAAIAGLSSAAGLGLLILFREEHERRRAFLIVGLLLGASIISGYVLQYLGLRF